MSTATAQDRPRRIALVGGFLFDGTADGLTPAPMVVIDGSTIAAVDAAVDPPADADVHDLAGATLLPGLIDTHVHLAFDATMTPVENLAERDDEAVVRAMVAAARTALLGGVTTVRDLGDRDYLSLGLRGRPDLPTLLCAGPPITLRSGHCHYLGGGIDSGVESARVAVQARVERGVDVIKIMASGGVLTPGTEQHVPQFAVDELRAMVEDAHRHGLHVTAHAHATAAVANALAAGVDGVEHATFWTEDGVESPAELMQELVDRRVVLGVTVGLVPSTVEGAGPPPAMVARLPGIIANTRRLYELGAVMVAGTDAGISLLKPHDVVRYAPAMLRMSGMTSIETLQAVTSVAATACGLGDVKGRLAVGYDADVLAVDGDPVTDPGALHRIRAVYARGTRVR